MPGQLFSSLTHFSTRSRLTSASTITLGGVNVVALVAEQTASVVHDWRSKTGLEAAGVIKTNSDAESALHTVFSVPSAVRRSNGEPSLHEYRHGRV